MKKALIFIVSLLITTTSIAQKNLDLVEKGAVMTLGIPNAEGFRYIELPRKNIIIKRGAIANFNNLEGLKVVVAAVRIQNDNIEVTLKRKDGLKFFRFWPTVTADLQNAIIQGELKIHNPNG